MKTKIKLLDALLVSMLLFTFSSCEKDLYHDEIKKDRIGKTELLTGLEAKKVANRLKTALGSRNSLTNNTLEKTITLDIGTINYDEILKIIDTYGKDNYTFQIVYPVKSDTKFANLILQEKNNYTTIKLIEYNMTEQFAQQYKLNPKLSQFKGSIKITSIFSDTPCPEPELFIQIGNIPTIHNGGGGGSGSDNNGGIPSGSGGGGGGPENNPSTLATISDEPTDDNNNNPVEHYHNYYYKLSLIHVAPTNPDVPSDSTDPCPQTTQIGVLTPIDKCTKSFLIGLGESARLYLYNNEDTYNQLMDYISTSPNCDEASAFGKEVLNGFVIDSCTILDFETFNNHITTNLPPCLTNVVNDLKVLPNGKFGQVISQFSGTNPVPLNYNWTINSASLGPNTIASTNPTIQGGVATTTINSDFTSISTDLSIAKTLIHECFHAYLNSVYRYRNIDKSYVALVNQYSAQFNNDANDIHHHLYTINNIVNEISLALKEYGISKGYNLTQQFYDDMAWGGLYGTQAYMALPTSQQERIESTIEAEFRNSNNSPANILGLNPHGVQICP